MQKRIMWINPVGSTGFDQPVQELLETAKQRDTCIDVVSLSKGPSHLTYMYYEAYVANELLDLILRAEEEDYDAAVIGCFYDVGLWEAREITDRLVVTAPCESSLHLAATLGKRIAIMVGENKWIPKMSDNVLTYGFREPVVSFKSVNLGVHDFQKDPQETRNRLTQLAKEAVEKEMAEVIILGCTAQFGFYKVLQEKLGVPVLEAVMTPVKYAEYLIELRNLFGWNHSKAYAYKSPPKEEIALWKPKD